MQLGWKLNTETDVLAPRCNLASFACSIFLPSYQFIASFPMGSATSLAFPVHYVHTQQVEGTSLYLIVSPPLLTEPCREHSDVGPLSNYFLSSFPYIKVPHDVHVFVNEHAVWRSNAQISYILGPSMPLLEECICV